MSRDKINTLRVGGVDYDIEDKRIGETPLVERMTYEDEKGLESGIYNKERYDAFREKYPNRVYLERYKEVDGVKHEYIYNKVALTDKAESPEDFDTEDAGYYLDSVPLRLGGRQKDGPEWYRNGHIRVPALSVDEFPTQSDAKGFAIGSIYADSAVQRNNERRLHKVAETIDDKCLAVESVAGNSSYLKFYTDDDSGFGDYIFQASLWWDGTNATGGDIEVFLDDSNDNRGFLFYVTHDFVGRLRIGSDTFRVDMKPYMPFKKWVNLRIEFINGVSTKVYVDDTFVIGAGAVTLEGVFASVQFVASKAFEGRVALANVALSTNITPNLPSEDYFDYDEYIEIPTSIELGRRGMIRSNTADVWGIEQCEDFTGEGEYVVVNKKYLRKLLGSAGSSGGKLYRHIISLSIPPSDWVNLTAVYYSSSNTPLTIQSLYSDITRDLHILSGESNNDMDYINMYPIVRMSYAGNYDKKLTIMHRLDSSPINDEIVLSLTLDEMENMFPTFTDTVTEV